MEVSNLPEKEFNVHKDAHTIRKKMDEHSTTSAKKQKNISKY